MQTLDWNQMSALGLILRINTEVLHPLGLAMARNPETGHSEQILVAPDGVFTYSERKITPSVQETKLALSILLSGLEVANEDSAGE